MLNITSNSNTKLKKNLKLGKEAIKTVRKYNIKSATKYTLDKFLIENNEKKLNIFPMNLIRKMKIKSINERIQEISPKIDNVRKIFISLAKSEIIKDFKNFAKFIKLKCSHMHCGNCGEKAIITSYILKEELKAKKVAAINMVVTPTARNQRYLGHCFNVIGLKRSANLQDPSTWGKNAVIVDTWANIVKPAKEGIKDLKNLFKIQPSEDLSFSDGVNDICESFHLDEKTNYSWEYYKMDKSRY